MIDLHKNNADKDVNPTITRGMKNNTSPLEVRIPTDIITEQIYLFINNRSSHVITRLHSTVR